MSQERYLQIKKEHQVRKFVGRFLFILLAILDVLLVSSHSNYVPLVTVAMVTIVPFNHFIFKCPLVKVFPSVFLMTKLACDPVGLKAFEVLDLIVGGRYNCVPSALI